MHNSLVIRDPLRKANADPMHIDRRDAHRAVAPDPNAICPEGYFDVRGGWSVSCNTQWAGADLLVEDMSDFLTKMAGKPSGTGGTAFRFRMNIDLAKRDCRLHMTPDMVEIEGGGAAGLWAGLAWMEREMRCARGPFLPVGTHEHKARWDHHISQGPYGGNYSVPDLSPEFLSDDAFRLYAHYGITTMMIYGDLLCYIDSDILPELNTPDYEKNIAVLKDATERAAKYGVEFYYIVVGAKLRPDHPVFINHPEVKGAGFERESGELRFLCTSNEKSHEFFVETFYKMFSRVKLLAGVNLIVANESYYHCRMWDDPRYPCPICSKKSRVEIIAKQVESVVQGVKKANPNAYICVWPYSYFTGDRIEMFEAMPEGITMFYTVDKDKRLQKDGYIKNIWDYSVDFIGPTEDIVRMAQRSRETGIPLFVRTETGIGLEVFQFPYVPAMQRLADKWQVVRDQDPKGVHQSWLFFGMFGSRAEELGLWAAYSDKPRDQFLAEMAARDFGPDAVDNTLKAWQCISDAAGHIPCICLTNYYIGPSYLGPCHPLVPKKDDPIPDIFSSYLFYLQEMEETFSVKRIDEAKMCLVMDSLPENTVNIGVVPDDPNADGWDFVLRDYTKAANEAWEGVRLLDEAAALTKSDADARNLAEERHLARLFACTMQACENTVRFLMARRDLENTGDQKYLAEMKRVAKLERENALAALPVYAACPWLDISDRIDGRYPHCADMIAEKVRWIDEFLTAP